MGWIQREIQEAAYQYQRAIETEREIVVGVNKFRVKETSTIPTLHIDAAIEATQVASLKQLRAERDNLAVANALAAIEKAAGSTENLMPHIINAVECYATVGEVSLSLTKVFGQYQEAVSF